MATSVKIVILAFCIAAIHSSSGEQPLKCYQCEGAAGSSNCAKGITSSMAVVECGQGPAASCFARDMKRANTRTFSRGCAGYTVGDLCSQMQQMAVRTPKEVTLVSCKTCKTTLCNTIV